VQKKEDEKVIKEVGKQVATLTKQELAQRPPALEQTKKSLEAVSELGERLEKMSLTRSEALKDLASASEKLKDELKQIAKDPALKKMEQAARSPSGRNAETAAGLQKQMDAMQKQLESKAKNPEAIDQLQKEMEKVQEAAKALASKSGQEADAAQQKLSAALSALNQQAAQAGVDLPQIDEAIAALASANTDRFMKEIEAALKDLDKLRDMKQKLDAMQAQAEKLGKDLAEQLKNGQAEAAADTLEKLAEKLKAANLSPEEMNKVLEEVSKALPESKEYGKVEDLLKQACPTRKSGDKQCASQSLADAAKELKDLMQQMNDAAAMMAALENLEQASMCVGQGKGWGQCKMPGNKVRGKNPGNGVGTWGEEGGEWQESYGEGTPYVDRSALNDRNQDGRGLSEREQSDLTDRLSPTKVKGQFSPGGPMPSITLERRQHQRHEQGAYEEATATAQADAQSALSQDKVPRAYQGAVKDYFDDFKK
jgi:DNA repair ATPase RecN